jgi:protocatechuate 3,4-dioxygenase beta subunit
MVGLLDHNIKVIASVALCFVILIVNIPKKDCVGAKKAAGGAKCTLSSESSEGPFFLPYQPIRSNITEGKPGVSLTINLTIKDVKTCQVVEGVEVHLWHSDAFGVYSAYSGYYPLDSPSKSIECNFF